MWKVLLFPDVLKLLKIILILGPFHNICRAEAGLRSVVKANGDFFVKKCFILNFASGTVIAISLDKKVSSHRISLVLFVLYLSHNGAPLLLRANPKIPQRYATSALQILWNEPLICKNNDKPA